MGVAPESRSVSPPVTNAAGTGNASRTPEAHIHIALLTGGTDRPYAFGLAMALLAKGVRLDVIGSSQVDSPEMHANPKLNFLNLQQGWRPDVSAARKLLRVALFYARLIQYAATTKAKIFHILWNNKVPYFDRTLLMLYYKFLGKGIVFTAHNVNAGKRDGTDSLWNRLTLRMQFHVADHLVVHTERMKKELTTEFNVPDHRVTVVPFGVNNSVPDTKLTPAEAKKRLGIAARQRTILFFGAMRPYKGVEHLLAAFENLIAKDSDYRLIIAGEPKKESAKYVRQIQERINREPNRSRIVQRIGFIPDEETELYFKAADVAVLPYTLIFQSGVVFLAYRFGLPVIAADVGSFREDIIEGRTGFVFKPCDAVDLARVIERYFESELFQSLEDRRQEIKDYVTLRHSWDIVGDRSLGLYCGLLGRRPL